MTAIKNLAAALPAAALVAFGTIGLGIAELLPSGETGTPVGILVYGQDSATAARVIAAADGRLLSTGGWAETVIAVSDSTAAIHNPNGLDVDRVVSWKQEHGSVRGFPGSTEISNGQLLELDCDVLIPAALEGQITGANAGNVRAKIVAEAANGPTTPEADEILHANGVFLIPDILCNAGGVTVSYFEWVQDLNRDHWSEAIVNEKLREIMVRAFGEVRDIAGRESCDNRTAAYLLAVKRVADATALRGLYP